MQDDAFVVVFPSEFSKHLTSKLVSNIKKILRVRGQNFEFVRRDGDVIVVRANDPVFASTAINQLFGIQKVAIARKTEPVLESIVSEVTRLGGNLLLKGEKFLVTVEGEARGFVPKDAEMAITSSIIEKKFEQGATPGSDSRYDKLLYTYITKSSAYVCIFLDRGHGGAPNLSQGSTLCPVHDEISAISCIEAARQGYDAKIIVPYTKRSELGRIAKLLSRTIQFGLTPKVDLEFYSFDAKKISGQYELQGSVAQLCRLVAEESGIPRVSVPITGQIFTAGFVDGVSRLLYGSGILPHYPLQGKEDSIREMARRYVLDKFVGRIRVQKKSEFPDVSERRFVDGASDALDTRRAISVKLGPNNVHDILDALE